MPVLARLELETHAYHREAERPWLALLAPSVSRTQYAEQLARAYGIEQPLEAALGHTPYLASLIAHRGRSRLLARDLFALDYGPLASIPRCWIAPFPSLAEAFGWLYVVERSARIYPMVGGHIVARMPQLETAVSYLDDPDAGDRWRELGVVLDRIAWSHRIEDEVISAAHTAFRTLADWYSPQAQPLKRRA